MANRTKWTAGNGAGLTPAIALNTSDLSSLATAHSMLSTVADIDNSTAGDMFADVMFELAIASSTLTALAAIGICVYDKFRIDGSNDYYGDNALTAGSSAAFSSNYQLYSWGPTITGAAQTLVTGSIQGIRLPPRSFRFALVNNLGFSLQPSGTAVSYVYYVTYNIDLNN